MAPKAAFTLAFMPARSGKIELLTSGFPAASCHEPPTPAPHAWFCVCVASEAFVISSGYLK